MPKTCADGTAKKVSRKLNEEIRKARKSGPEFDGV